MALIQRSSAELLLMCCDFLLNIDQAMCPARGGRGICGRSGICREVLPGVQFFATKLVFACPLPGDTLFDDFGGVACKNGLPLLAGPVDQCVCADDAVAWHLCAFEEGSALPHPDVIANHDVFRRIEAAPAVGVHNGVTIRCA